jgi:hypothetical protein
MASCSAIESQPCSDAKHERAAEDGDALHDVGDGPPTTE